MAASLLAKVTGWPREFADYKALAKNLIDDKREPDKARMLYDQAGGFAGNPAGTVEYATGLAKLYEDKKRAEELLAVVREDCMFSGKFVALTMGYRILVDNTIKVAELLQRGSEFVMRGEENLDLANGYAAEKCGDAVRFGQLISQLRSFRESLHLQRELYGIGE